MTILARIIRWFFCGPQPVCTERFDQNSYEANCRYAQRIFRVNGFGFPKIPREGDCHPMDCTLIARKPKVVRQMGRDFVVLVAYEPPRLKWRIP